MCVAVWRRYIHSIDVEADIQVLAKFNIRKSCVRVYRISLMVLKIAAALDCTLFQISTFMQQVTFAICFCRGHVSASKAFFFQTLVSIGLL